MKISVGKHKKTQNNSTYPEKIVFTVGIVLMCAILLSPLSRVEENPFAEEAVLVMSAADKEKIMIPDDKAASSEKKWSFYDYIGELFANLIFGED